MKKEFIDELIAICLNEAKALNILITVSIIDITKKLIASKRMDGCDFSYIDESKEKAVAALELSKPTHEIAAFIEGAPEMKNNMKMKIQS